MDTFVADFILNNEQSIKATFSLAEEEVLNANFEIIDVLIIKEDTEKIETLLNDIYGDEEVYTTNLVQLISASNTCDEIIGKENTSSAYSEIELDTIDKLELKVDVIIGE